MLLKSTARMFLAHRRINLSIAITTSKERGRFSRLNTSRSIAAWSVPFGALAAGRGWLLSPLSHAKDWSDQMQPCGHVGAITRLDALTLSEVESNQELSEELWILLGARSPVCEQFLTG